MQTAKVINLRKGTPVYRQGFPAEGIFLLCRGSVKLTTVSEAGVQRIAAFVICGELFGLDSILPEPVRCLTAVARESVQAAFISTEKFHKALHAKPELLWSVAMMLNDMFHRANRDKLAISGARVRERIESVLLDLTYRAKQFAATGKPAFARLKQRELSELLGVPEETICRELRAMRGNKVADLLTTRKDELARVHSA